MKTTLLTLILLCTAFVMTACENNDTDIDINPSALPSTIIDTVQNALTGINITEAEVKTKSDSKKKIYKLEGELINGNEYDIEIHENGTIIKIELDD